MRGDFSAWNKDRSHNFRGTLHQQGRVMLERDWNAQTEITGEWQETAARDAFGAGVAAVPAEIPDSFKVMRAKNVPAGGGKPAHVEIGLKQGRVWADGLLAELSSDTPPPVAADWLDANAVRTATYLGPPIQGTPAPSDVPPTGVGVDVRDAVILETWLEELSPFQDPDLLLEPALGGVDTTERVQTAFRLRLYRMDDGDTCDSIIPKLEDNFDLKGKLRVELKPTNKKDGDCPVVESGGFTGFEHRLYRIEIADTDRPAPEAYFKWSHFNGGLVGTGVFDAVNCKVAVHGNKNAIAHSGLNSFYLEALDYNSEFGCWRVIYGAKATLEEGGTLSLHTNPGDIFKGKMIPSGKRFFRLWNGIERVADFTAQKDLPDNLGILIKFGPEGVGKYTPSDFWTFEARADGDDDQPVLIGDPSAAPGDPVATSGSSPQGIFYHRVPLAQLHWTGSGTVKGNDITDCRRSFQPLTKLNTCCTYRVGDGIRSHGDFKTVQEAINALPKNGGEVCILPGLYEENVEFKAPHNRNVILSGCGVRTVIKAPADKPAIYVEYGQGITIESLAVDAHEDGIGISLVGEERTEKNDNKENYLKDIVLSELFVLASKDYAIKGYTAQSLTLKDSVVHIKEMPRYRTREHAVYLEGDDMLIEHNEIRVLPNHVWSEYNVLTNDPDEFITARTATGGLQIGGGSERVRIINNLISGGTGNGISLGRIDLMKDGEVKAHRGPFRPAGQGEDCCNPDDGFEDIDEEDDQGFVAIAGPALYDILIKFNRICNMGRNGIGVTTFFNVGDEMDLRNVVMPEEVAVKGVIVISKLVIINNRIERCMNIPPQAIRDTMLHLMGFGGIALGFVGGLVIRDNFIVDNCRDCRAPICGIYVLAATAMDISRNEITEHLSQNLAEVTAGNVRSGPRGGIWVSIALGQTDALSGSRREKYDPSDVLRNISGSHAARIHENVVSVPLGRSLTMTILGDASILGNRFTSYGIVPVDIVALFKSIIIDKSLDVSAVLQLVSLLAGNILIFDLALYVLYRELKRLQAKAVAKDVETGEAGGNLNYNMSAPRFAQAYADVKIVLPIINRLTRVGMVHFSNNQCKLNPLNRETSVAYSSIFIIGLADSGFHDNQTSCNIPTSLMVTNASLFGGTQRMTGNWLKETFERVAFSAMTFGILNATTDNESVHCLKVTGIQWLDRHNLILGAVLAGAVGDVAEDQTRNKLLGACSRRNARQILAQMYLAIMRDQGDTASNAAMKPYVDVDR